MSNPFGKLPGGMQGMVNRMLQQTQQMEQQLATERFSGGAGGGAVKAVVNGKGELLELTIAKEVVDPEDIEMLQDLIITAVRDVMEQATKKREDQLKNVLPPGFNIPGLS
jgi:DNA-binding YbaB/EbfC family protein